MGTYSKSYCRVESGNGWWEHFIMKRKRINFAKKGIENLQDRYGYTPNQAEMMWRRSYKQAWYRAKKAGIKDINITREVYSSMFFKGNQLFDIKLDDVTPRSRISSQFVNEDNIQKAFIETRFKGMAESYSEVNKYLKQYSSGKISYTQFKAKIADFKISNQAYLKAGS